MAPESTSPSASLSEPLPVLALVAVALSRKVGLSAAVPVPPALDGGVSTTLKVAVPVVVPACEPVRRRWPVLSTVTESVPPPVRSAAGVLVPRGSGE